MPELPKADLLNRVESAIRVSGWRSFVTRATHPFEIRAGLETATRNLIIYLWTVTSGGPSAVRPPDEYRIQITGVASPLLTRPNTQTLLLGWHEESAVFAAFDVQRHQTFGRSPSIQVRLGTLEEAARFGFAFQMRGNNEIVVAFAADQFMNYAMNQRNFHRFGRHPEQVQVLSAARETDLSAEELESIPAERQEMVRSVRSWVRERDFRERVLTSYSHRCAVCHIQLRLVEAAHIVPVHVPGSNDLTSNGLALCASHHVAYDDALLTIAPDYHILVSENRLNELREGNLHQGQELLLQYVCNTIWLPTRPEDRPDPQYLTQGMQTRGWRLTKGFVSKWTRQAMM